MLSLYKATRRILDLHRLLLVQLSCVPICEISKSFKNQISMPRNVDYYFFLMEKLYMDHI
jgi:hypothetical protein